MTPATEAGKRLLASDFDTTGWGPSTVRRHVVEAVAAIEAEAVAARNAEIAGKIERDLVPWLEDYIGGTEAPAAILRHVLALLDPKP